MRVRIAAYYPGRGDRAQHRKTCSGRASRAGSGRERAGCRQPLYDNDSHEGERMKNPPEKATAVERGSLPARILVVEDELPMPTALQDILADERYRVLAAEDVEGA